MYFKIASHLHKRREREDYKGKCASQLYSIVEHWCISHACSIACAISCVISCAISRAISCAISRAISCAISCAMGIHSMVFAYMHTNHTGVK